MKRIAVYLKDETWELLSQRARVKGIPVSAFVRQTLRERFTAEAAAREKAMLSVVGLWRNRRDFGDAEAYVRRLRTGTRLERLAKLAER